MGLLSTFTGKRESSSMAPLPADALDSVQAARSKARHRLIGAVVLLLVGIIGFPIVFETQPRPTPVDIAIEIPRKENAPPLVAPAARALPAPPAASANPVPGRSDDGAAARKLAPPTAAPVQAPSAAASTAALAKPEPAPKAGPAPAAPAPSAKPAVVDAKTTGPAALTAKPKAAPNQGPAAPVAAADGSGARFVVQVGAFADAASAQLMRGKAEKLGLKTYTQVTETAAGNRVRVRIGPFATREAAEQALAKAKAGGLSAVVLTL
jgi:DedD protein